MSGLEKYRQYFTRDFLMGPNSFRLLDELLQRKPWDAPFGRTLDLGCGMAMTSVFLANETDAKQIYAFDLWVSATDNFARVREHGLEDIIIPIHGDAMDIPFAQGYFDTAVSVDAYHYFGCGEGIFSQKVLPYVKKGGCVLIAVPGLKEQPQGALKTLFEEWAEGDDAELFKTADWWKAYLEKECAGQCEIIVREAACFDLAWQEWFDSGHEYGARDKEFLDRGLDQVLNFVLMYVRKK